jgi:hypothetical protein
MPIVKNALDFILRNVLRIRRAENRHREPGRRVDGGDAPTLKTLRTYPPGGDPFDDMIEFVLKDGGAAPSGFRIPPGEKGDTE